MNHEEVGVLDAVVVLVPVNAIATTPQNKSLVADVAATSKFYYGVIL
jgi:hypothetical protein